MIQAVCFEKSVDSLFFGFVSLKLLGKVRKKEKPYG